MITLLICLVVYLIGIPIFGRYCANKKVDFAPDSAFLLALAWPLSWPAIFEKQLYSKKILRRIVIGREEE